MSSTRFHACERFDQCQLVKELGKSVVYVNPAPMGSEDWGRYLGTVKEKLKHGEEVTSLVRCPTPCLTSLFLTVPSQLCPLWRHSPSYELQAFVKLFRPHRVIPNTLDPGLENLDWIAIENVFRDCLSSHGQTIVESIGEDVTKNMSECDVSARLDSWAELAGHGEKRDTALMNLEGGIEVVGLVTQWMAAEGNGLKKLQMIQERLPEYLKIRLGEGISKAKAKIQALAEERLQEESQAKSEQSVETDEDFYDDRGNTAHRIFGGSSFIRSERSSSASFEEEAGFHMPASSSRKIRNYSRSLAASPVPPSSIFNQEYADWFKSIAPPEQQLKQSLKTPEPKKPMNILSPSTNKANAVHPLIVSEPRPVAIQNSTSQTLLPHNLAPAPSSASIPATSTLPPSFSKRSNITPPSTSTTARRDKRRVEREERQRMALNLGRARPDSASKFLGFVWEELR